MSNSARIVSGEASESDEEVCIVPPTQHLRQNPGGSPKTKSTEKKYTSVSAARQKAIKQRVVVSGEASESSDEDVEIDTSEVPITPLTVDQRARGDSLSFSSDSRPDSQTSESPEKDVELQYDTLLHRKLRESNANLRRHLCDSFGQVYLSSAKEIRNMTQGLLRSLTDIQDVAENMRGLTNTLFLLEDKVDIVSGCNLLPIIDISPATTPSSPQSSPSL